MSSSPPTLRIDLASPVPAYRQVAEGLRALWLAGSLEVGGQLPTVRELALELGVHHNTVAEAYRLLAAEGWLELARRRGATVLVAPASPVRPAQRARVLQRLRDALAEARALGVPDAELAALLSPSKKEISP